MPADLTGLVRALIDTAGAGRVLTCAHGTESHAELIRELVLGRRGDVAPRGVRVLSARVTGELDLVHVTAGTGLSLVDCDFPAPVDLSSATVPWPGTS